MDGLCELDGLKGYFPAVYKQNCPSITEAHSVFISQQTQF